MFSFINSKNHVSAKMAKQLAIPLRAVGLPHPVLASVKKGVLCCYTGHWVLELWLLTFSRTLLGVSNEGSVLWPPSCHGPS